MPHSAFNELMRQFIHELQACFPEDDCLNDLSSKFETACQANVRAPFQLFHDFVWHHTKQVIERDKTFVQEALVNAMPGVDQVWDKADDDTRDVIWDYISSLTFVAMGIETLTVHPEHANNILQLMKGNLP